MSETVDVIDTLAGISPGDRWDALRRRRPESRSHAQGAYEALFVSVDAAEMSPAERFAVAVFVAQLHGDDEAVRFYGGALDATPEGARLADIVRTEARRASHPGPYGAFLHDNAPESVPGPTYSVGSVEAAYALGDRLGAALEHAHMLVLHPRDASRAHLQQLLDAGWSTTGIVTLSQLVSFLAFQLRVAAGVRAMRAAGSASTEGDRR